MASSDQSKTDRLRSALAELEKQCGVAAGTVTLGADGLVSFVPSPDEKYEKVECVARGLMQPQFADHIKIGFVGNDAAASEEKE